MEQRRLFYLHCQSRQIMLIFSPSWFLIWHSVYLITYCGIASISEQIAISDQIIYKLYIVYSFINIICYYMNNQFKNCTLHNILLEYFCQKCLEPVCRQCTVLGPHNTPIHSITPIANAYQRRVQELKDRIGNLLSRRQSILSKISILNNEIQQLKVLKELAFRQNESERIKMCRDVQTTYDHISGQINSIKQAIERKINEINDYGHTFENTVNDIEVIAIHSQILHGIKESMDRLEIILSQNLSLPELPKVLSNLRFDLKQIEIYEDLFRQKIQLIHITLHKLDEHKSKIQKPAIKYEELLKILDKNIKECIHHAVCHFCGSVYTVDKANTMCNTNSSVLNINQFVGSCLKKPDVSKWGTKRHYFDVPLNKFQYFKQQELNSFKIHMNSLLLKLKSICMIKSLSLDWTFMQIDKSKRGQCTNIQMSYCLIQICGLLEQEKDILLTLCQTSAPNIFSYSNLIKRLNEISI